MLVSPNCFRDKDLNSNEVYILGVKSYPEKFRLSDYLCKSAYYAECVRKIFDSNEVSLLCYKRLEKLLNSNEVSVEGKI